MLLLVGPPERSIARNNCPSSPPGLIVSPKSRLPPRLTWVIWSNVGVTFGFCALLERMHQNGLLKLLAPPTKRLPLVSTSSVPHTGELGILSGLCQVSPPSVDRLNCPKLQVAAVLHASHHPFEPSSGVRQIKLCQQSVEHLILSLHDSSRLR